MQAHETDPTTVAVPTAVTRRGRPRSPQADAGVLSAALDELEEAGYARFTIEAVARRAGLGRPTVYRRYPTKGALVVAACRGIAARHVQVPDTGDLREDVLELLGGLAWVFTHTRARRIVPGLLAAREEHPELADAARVVWQSRRDALLEVLRRAAGRGDLAPHLDLEVATDLLYGPLYYRLLVTGEPLDRELAAQLTDLALSGISAPTRGRRPRGRS